MNVRDFRIGDRARLLPLEGQIGWVSDDESHVRLDYDDGGGELLSTRTLERTSRRLPTTPGSVVKFPHLKDTVYLLTPQGWTHSARRGSEVDMGGETSDFILIFDAGTSS